MKAAIVVVLALTAWDEVAYLRRRVSLRTSSWWGRVDHRQRSHLHELELAHLVRRFGPR